MRETIDESTGSGNDVVVDWRGQPRRATRSARFVIKRRRWRGHAGLRPRGPLLPRRSTRFTSVENGAEVTAGDVLARIPREGRRKNQVTSPAVCRAWSSLFEARTPKDHAIICGDRRPHRVRQGLQEQQRRILDRRRKAAASRRVPGPEGAAPRWSRRATTCARGEHLMDGNPAPHDILRGAGREALADLPASNEIQEVYRLQGVKINDKHIETIVRQMMRRVKDRRPGDTNFLSGDQVEQADSSRRTHACWRRRHASEPAALLLGITKAIAVDRVVHLGASSFQETTKVLYRGGGYRARSTTCAGSRRT